MEDMPIGKVTATESRPTSCSTVRFWLHGDQVIRPFDVVRIPHLRNSYTYAVVRDLEYITDSAGHLADYVSSDFGDVMAEPHSRRMGTTVAEADVLYNTKDIEMPLRDGARVQWADPDGIRQALGLGALKNPVAAGYISTSNGQEIPVEFEGNYLLGPEGAHLNISGISGLATKTSYAMFLMNSVQQRFATEVAMIIFNVKGTDLLAIDQQPAEPLRAEDERKWRTCGLEPQPFENVTYLYPFAKRPEKAFCQSSGDTERLRLQQEEGRAYNYFYDVESGTRRLRLLFSDIDDPTQSMESIFGHIGGSEYSSWAQLRSEVEANTRKGVASHQKGGITQQSWRKFHRLLQTRTVNDVFTERAQVKAEQKRQVLVREGLEQLSPGGVLVIDVEPLASYLQALVFGDVIDSIYESLLSGEEGLAAVRDCTVVVFADELNKYAPKYAGKEKALTGNLLEITERGRSMGVVLFGAEQFRSGVHDRILGNCSSNVFGRTSPVEVERCPDYRYFPRTHKWAVQRLEQGELLLQHAIFRTALIKVRFPRPAYYQPKRR
jgi:hypothetical protein